MAKSVMTKPIDVCGLVLGAGMPKICVPLIGKNESELRVQAAAAKEAGAELVEWRADFFEKLEEPERLQAMLQTLTEILGDTPLLFTIRTVEEGGSLAVSPENYARINLAAARSGGAALVDVEIFSGGADKKPLIQSIQEQGCRVIASSHDFAKTDAKEQLLERFEQMNRTGADILKMAVMPKTPEDVVTLMQATKEMTTRTARPLISMSMGKLGEESRVLGEKFGSSLTFATVEQASAPGQIPIALLRPRLAACHAELQE